VTVELPSELPSPDLAAMEDDDLVHVARAGCEQALEFLISKYRDLAASSASGYFLAGADREDLIQEGMIGLFKAIRDFRPDKGVPFRAFARMCIQRQIITAVKAATRQKHLPLNGYVSLSKPLYRDDSTRTLIEVLKMEYTFGPEEMVILREEFAQFEQIMGEILTNLEWRVLMCHLDTSFSSYREIAEEVGCSWKAVDNALQRVKRKLEAYLSRRRRMERHT